MVVLEQTQRPRQCAGLLAKAKAFNEEGLTAYIYSGGYNVPPITLTGSVRTDMLFVPEVIGAGEIAISDARSTEPTDGELARLVRDAYVGGLLTGKSGVTHFHVGSGKKRLRSVRALLDEYEIEPSSLYPTHMDRSEELMLEAIELSHRGVTVDLDTVDGELPRWMSFYLERWRRSESSYGLVRCGDKQSPSSVGADPDLRASARDERLRRFFRW